MRLNSAPARNPGGKTIWRSLNATGARKADVGAPASATRQIGSISRHIGGLSPKLGADSQHRGARQAMHLIQPAASRRPLHRSPSMRTTRRPRPHALLAIAALLALGGCEDNPAEAWAYHLTNHPMADQGPMPAAHAAPVIPTTIPTPPDAPLPGSL